MRNFFTSLRNFCEFREIKKIVEKLNQSFPSYFANIWFAALENSKRNILITKETNFLFRVFKNSK